MHMTRRKEKRVRRAANKVRRKLGQHWVSHVRTLMGVSDFHLFQCRSFYLNHWFPELRAKYPYSHRFTADDIVTTVEL